MRMRRKKNLDARLNEASEYLISIEAKEKNTTLSKEIKNYLNIKEIFGNDNPLFLEIGCGKGGFACEFARQNPNINLLAVEKTANVIVTAAETAQKMELKNLRFVNCPAEYLSSYIKENSVQRIFLNFSCPFPKKKYANHRLTAPRFLEIYKEILIEYGEIHQKTDNMGLFEFSIENLSQNGFALKNISLNLHESNFEDNIMTEYEKRFTDLGQPIYRLEAVNKKF